MSARSSRSARRFPFAGRPLLSACSARVAARSVAALPPCRLAAASAARPEPGDWAPPARSAGGLLVAAGLPVGCWLAAVRAADAVLEAAALDARLPRVAAARAASRALPAILPAAVRQAVGRVAADSGARVLLDPACL